MCCFIIHVAEQTIAVSAQYERTQLVCRNHLCDLPSDISISITQSDIDYEREKSAREDMLEGKAVREFSDAYLETLAVQRKVTEELFRYDTLLFHGSVVAVDGEGYLFTAKSGTGKSTHTRLWREVFGERAVMVNDDKPFLRITEEGVYACGSPWNGKHGLGTNITVPLKGICILERGEENRICPITPQEALYMLIQQSNRPRDPGKMPQYLSLLDRLSTGVKFYRLTCNTDPQAAITAYEGMK